MIRRTGEHLQDPQSPCISLSLSSDQFAPTCQMGQKRGISHTSTHSGIVSAWAKTQTHRCVTLRTTRRVLSGKTNSLPAGALAENVRIAVARPKGGLPEARSPDGTTACTASVVTEGRRRVGQTSEASRAAMHCYLQCLRTPHKVKLFGT